MLQMVGSSSKGMAVEQLCVCVLYLHTVLLLLRGFKGVSIKYLYFNLNTFL